MISLKKVGESFKLLFLSIFVVMNSGYMLQVCEGSTQTFIQYFTIIMLFVFLFKDLIIHNKLNHSNKSMLVCLFFIFFYLFSMISNGERFTPYLNQIAIIFSGYYLVDEYGINKVASTFVWVMFIISCISLLFLIWINLFGIPNAKLVSTNVSVNQVYDYHLFFYPKLFGNSIVRNQGIFWEPGLFASYILIALILEILFSKKINIYRFAVLVVTLLTTSSTAGILLLIPIFILLIERNMKKERTKTIVLMILWIILLLLFIFSNNLISWLVSVNSDLFGKLISNDISKITRLNVPFLNLEIFKSHPIFGAGLAGTTNQFQNLKSVYMVDSQTSTSTYMLAVLGIFGIMYTFLWIKSVFEINSYTFTRKIAVLFIILAILNKEPHNSLMATWIVFFLFYKNSVLKCKKENENNIIGGNKNEFI